jgi:hypothetical protein
MVHSKNWACLYSVITGELLALKCCLPILGDNFGELSALSLLGDNFGELLALSILGDNFGELLALSGAYQQSLLHPEVHKAETN